MKLSASGLKGLNWKQFLLDHGEKLVLGGVVLVGLGALAATRWAPYSEKTPYGLIRAVDEAKQTHATSTWPEAEETELTSTEDINAKAQQLLSPLDDAKFAFSRTLPELNWPIIPQKKQAEEPTWFPVQNLVASFGRVLYAKAPSMDDMLAATETADAEELPAEDRNNRALPPGFDASDFSPSERQPGAFPGAPGFPGLGPGGAHGGPAGAHGGAGGAHGGGGEATTGRGRGRRGRGDAGGPSGAHGGGGGSPGGAHGGGGMPMSPYGDMYGEGGYGYGMAGPVEAEAKRFISVRGVFPIKKQERELAEALGLQSAAQVVNLLEFLDFELERKRAVQGPNPWAGEWEKVDIEVALDVLNEQANFAADIVDPSVTNHVFTMPLPGRIIGQWEEEDASHPALTQFELTEDAQRQQQWLQERIAEYAARLEEEQSGISTPGGFASQTYDARQIGSMMVQDQDYMADMMTGGMYGSMPGYGTMPGMAAQGRPGGDPLKLTEQDIKNMITASGTYLLFRYLDFDVQSGNAYRYRVRLKVKNPNFGRDPGEVVRNDVAEGEFRWTDWSEPTGAVIVPDDMRHFLVNIESPSPNTPDRAEFRVYQWSEDHGTIVDEFLAVEPGQFIGGTKKALVIDPAAGTFEEQDFEFTSDDVLVDVDRNAMNLASRPELGITDRRFRVPSQVLIVNEWGGLEVQDPVSTADNRAAWDAAMDDIESSYAYLRDQAAATDETGMPYEEGGYGEMYGGEGGMGPANPLRRGRGRGRGQTGMEGMNPYGYGSEMAVPGSEGGQSPRRRRR